MILFSPQISDRRITYSFNGDSITAKTDELGEIFDFTGLPDGSAETVISEILDFNPIIRAVRENGILKVELLNFIGPDATEDERFPVWKEV